MTQNLKEKALLAAKALAGRKGMDIVILEVGEQTIIADYFVICSGTSNTHVKTLADELEMKMGEAGYPKIRMEGYQEGRWIVVDFGDILVHVFHKDEREY